MRNKDQLDTGELTPFGHALTEYMNRAGVTDLVELAARMREIADNREIDASYLVAMMRGEHTETRPGALAGAQEVLSLNLAEAERLAYLAAYGEEPPRLSP